MPTGLVSILIPAYRAGQYIGQTLESIRAQTHTNWEALVLEDGIFDDTAATVKAFAASVPQSVRLVQREQNGGVSRARNSLLDLAQGEFIAFLDADDVWLPDHLTYSIDRLNEEKADWIVGGLNLIDPQNKLLEADVLPEVVPPEALPARLLAYNFILPSAMVSRAQVFAGGLRFDHTLSVGEDLDLCIRIVDAGHRVAYSQRATLNYRKHPTSATADPARFSEGMTELYEKYLHSPLVNRAACSRSLRNALLNTARLTRKRQPERCARAAKRLVQLAPWNLPAWIYWLSVIGRKNSPSSAANPGVQKPSLRT